MITVSRIGSKTVISETVYADDGNRGGGSDAPMGGLVMRRCACGKCNNGGDCGTIDVAVNIAVALDISYSRAVSGQDSMEQGQEGGYLGASFVATDRRVQVFGPSSRVDRPSEHL